MARKACKNCKRLVEGKECVVCKNNDLSRNWKGTVVIFDSESEIGKKSGHKVAGTYALQVL